MSSLRPFQRGLTLVEILCVAAIILLLLGLALPALMQGKAEAKKGVCIVQTHQVSIALMLYREESGAFPRSHSLDVVVEQGFLKEPRLLLCPKDEFHGLWSKHSTCDGYHFRRDQSYYVPFNEIAEAWEFLMGLDPNPGILACRVHGQRSEWYGRVGRDPCMEFPFVYEGPVLRVRMDGSAKMAPFSLRPRGKNAFRSFWFFELFTDNPMPKFE